jgi:hypothetical protein
LDSATGIVDNPPRLQLLGSRLFPIPERGLMRCDLPDNESAAAVALAVNAAGERR